MIHNNNNEIQRIDRQQKEEHFYLSEANRQDQFNKEYNLKLATFDWDKFSKEKKFALEWDTATNHAKLWNAQAKAYNKPIGKLETVEIDGKKKFVWYGYDPSTESFILKNVETAEGVHYGPSQTDKLLSTFVKEMIPHVQADPDMNIQALYDKFSQLKTDVGTMNKPKDKKG